MLWRNPKEGSSRPCCPSRIKMLKRDSPPPSACRFGDKIATGHFQSLQELSAIGLNAKVVGGEPAHTNSPLQLVASQKMAYTNERTIKSRWKKLWAQTNDTNTAVSRKQKNKHRHPSNERKLGYRLSAATSATLVNLSYFTNGSGGGDFTVQLWPVCEPFGRKRSE